MFEVAWVPGDHLVLACAWLLVGGVDQSERGGLMEPNVDEVFNATHYEVPLNQKLWAG
jgi:hypothetical protein